MRTAELIYEKAKSLPNALQTEALHFVDYLLTRQAAKTEARDWTKFSAEQLAKHYSIADSIYDEDEGAT